MTAIETGMSCGSCGTSAIVVAGASSKALPRVVDSKCGDDDQGALIDGRPAKWFTFGFDDAEGRSGGASGRVVRDPVECLVPNSPRHDDFDAAVNESCDEWTGTGLARHRHVTGNPSG